MPDVGVLSAHLLSGFQKELFTRLAEAGHEHLRPRHGAVLAYIAGTGTRASELSERSGQHKQVIGTLIDELERLGYVTRQPDPADRRAKLVVPTDLGRDQMVQARRIIADIENRLAQLVGPDRFAEFKAVFTEIARAH
ncbi:MarR family winged helix-turn-helix transcriptional regulator [Lentzea sp. BCCO 10_0061]|uniref:MarR family winged helix-turn-helix transcriptional regulator n=1 Tax=Lentzea sokolovensis TaxID=3095429 RepID=A0ABU4VB24_9PSEU|nr:MarR family winged helix-turn-helix transcriptional regulator [Lentzea sp. BCCO 10_0061]MDX8149005.1 MarR family winged helix-turn-helix transcriptional regulator [Lentzea sp. BCCO 10_0061]